MVLFVSNADGIEETARALGAGKDFCAPTVGSTAVPVMFPSMEVAPGNKTHQVLENIGLINHQMVPDQDVPPTS